MGEAPRRRAEVREVPAKLKASPTMSEAGSFAYFCGFRFRGGVFAEELPKTVRPPVTSSGGMRSLRRIGVGSRRAGRAFSLFEPGFLVAVTHSS